MKQYVRWSMLSFIVCSVVGPLLFQNCSKVDFTVVKRDISSKNTLNASGICNAPGVTIYHDGDVTLSGPNIAYIGAKQRFQIILSNPCLQFSNIVWQAGDGSAKQQAVPPMTYDHVYTNPGHYIVSVYLVGSTHLPIRLDHVIDIVDVCPTSAACQSSASLNVNQYVLHGPSVAAVNEDLRFYIVPEASSPSVVETWNFGDAAAISSRSSVTNHSYSNPGVYTVTANIRTENGETRTLKHSVTVVSVVDSDIASCGLSSISLLGQTRLAVNQKGHYQIHLKDCELPMAIRWFVDDVEVDGNAQYLDKSWANQGLYHIEARVYANVGDSTPKYVLNLDVWVTNLLTPLDLGTSSESLTCGIMSEGAHVILDSELTSKKVACGNNGFKTQYFKGQNEYECRTRALVLINQMGTMVSETSCQNQSCAAPGGATMAPGESKTFYSASLAQNSCADVSQSRTCNGDTGILGGDIAHSLLTCRSGCGAFGLDGTEKEMLSTDTIEEAKVCTNAEPGINDVFQKKIQQKCINGTVTDISTSKGGLITAGVCPVYAWVSTGWESCSADCGGTQAATYSCQVNGALVAQVLESRCGIKPALSQVCDGNSAVSQVSAAFEYANATATCPANKIGSIIREREVTTTMSCQNHVMTPDIVNSAWTENTYCREIVPFRCSQDSLSPSQAYGRLRWMQKCAASVSTIQEFFNRTASEPYAPQNVFATSASDIAGGQVSFGRLTYGTFLNADGSPWVAPAPGTADWSVYSGAQDLDLSSYSCDVPSGAYLASVCTSSCATPTQRVLTDVQSNQYETFISALINKRQTLTTLAEGSVSGRMSYQNSKVQNFVTELVDSKHEILTFKMASGGQVELTPNHPILTEDGAMKEAREWKVGNSMVQVSGLLDPVVSISKSTHSGKVYNVFMANDKPMNNVIVTEGYLNGSAFFQNQGIDLLNRQIIRTQFTNGVK